VDISLWNGWFPIAHRAKATHSERASERMEARTSWRTKLALLVSVLATYYFFKPHEYPVIAAITLNPKANEAVGFIPAYLLLSMEVVGTILQITLNWRSRSFAGDHKISVLLMLALNAISVANFVPALVGRYGTRPPLHAHLVVGLVLALLLAWQALVFPTVPQILEEDHTE